MSRINGDKSRAAQQRKRTVLQRAKARAIRAAKTAKAQPAKSPR